MIIRILLMIIGITGIVAFYLPLGKKGIVNVDILSENYEDGDDVTLDSLKAKGLISERAEFVKVLARGLLDKRLNVKLQDYSLEAVKMIVLVGGTINYD